MLFDFFSFCQVHFVETFSYFIKKIIYQFVAFVFLMDVRTNEQNHVSDIPVT